MNESSTLILCCEHINDVKLSMIIRFSFYFVKTFFKRNIMLF